MKTALALRHLHFEDVGTFDTVLAEQGYALHYVDPAGDDLAGVQDADLLIVLGGPIGAHDDEIYPFLADELSIVRQRLETGRSLLGICLGAQLLARALGARVCPMAVKEIGFAPLTLTAEGRESVLAVLGETPVLHWHGDQFDVPADGVHLAGTSLCAKQAFSVGRNVLGLQFHLEADVSRIEQWLVGHANELGQEAIDPRRLRADAARLGERLTTAGRTVLADWLAGLDDHEVGP